MKAFLGVLFAALVFYRPDYIQDNLTNAGWVYLSILALLYSLLFLNRRILVIPSRKILLFVGIFSALFVISSIINGATFLEERWTQRYLVFLLLFFSFQFFEKEQDLAEYLKIPISAFTVFICLESLYQYLFLCESNDPLGPSCFSSRMWNCNILSQALVLTIPFLLVFRKNSTRFYNRFFDLLVVLSTVIILLTGCRSSLLALAVFFLIQYAVPFVISRKRTTLLLLASVLCFTPLYLYKKSTMLPFGEGKRGSAQYRLEVWGKTIEMSFDFPKGVGVNNFAFGFLPYKRESKIENIPWEVDKSPHNEFVRILGEEGWVVFIAVLAAFSVFFFKTARSIFSGRLEFLHRLLLIALPELFFQFPTEMYLPVFLGSIAIGAFSEKRLVVRSWPAFRAFLVLISASVACLFLVRTIQIVPPNYSLRYCSLFPDNWKMCGEYFKAHFDSGEQREAMDTLRPIIKRQPFNFIALNFDYLFGDEAKNRKIACNYAALFNGKHSIEGSDISGCAVKEDRSQLFNDFREYARTR